MISIKPLHDHARRAVAAGEAKLKDAAEYLAKAAELGATQQQSAKMVQLAEQSGPAGTARQTENR